MNQTFSWQAEGFAAPPVPVVATGKERVYRAWGGTSTQLGNPNQPGVCFSFDRAASRYEAELLYSVMEWGNAVIRLTEFSIPKDTPIWVGKVDPGDRRAALGSFSGSQIYILRAYIKDLSALGTTILTDDLHGQKFGAFNRIGTA